MLNTEVVVLAHPTPEFGGTLLAIPLAHCTELQAIDARSLAAALQSGVRSWASWFGAEPGFNICVLAGPLVGHVHAELVLRTNTNIIAGIELATSEATIIKDPKQVGGELGLLFLT